MGFLRMIADEFRRVIHMTFVEPIQKGKRYDPGWARDRHLRNGFLIAIPLFVVPMLLIILSGSMETLWPVVLLAALVANVVWLGYAGWSRARKG